MGRGHKHTWCPHPPGGRWRQSWDEVYWDEEEMANNLNTNSQDKMEDLKFFLSRDPNFRNSEDWPELVEWCSCCPAVRKVKFVMKDTEVTNEEKVDEDVKVIAEKVEVEEMIVVKVREEEPVVNVEEVKVVEEKIVGVKCEDVKEEKDETLKLKEPDVKSSREVCTQTHLAASSNNTQTAILERVNDGGKEVGCQTEGSKRKRRGGGRGSRMRRLLNYQHFLTEKRGLPLSRLLSLSMKKTEARFTRHRKKREEEVSASPQLRRSEVREEEGGEASSPSSSIPDPLQPLPPAFPYHTLPPPFYPSYTPSYIPPYAPPYTHTYTPPSSPPYSPPHTLPCAPPYTLPNTPPYTLPNTPPYTPLCGPIPGPQWLFCGPCYSCGSIVPLTNT